MADVLKYEDISDLTNLNMWIMWLMTKYGL